MTDPWVKIAADWPTARAAGRNRQALREQGYGSSLRTREDVPHRENVIGSVAERAFAEAVGLPPPRFRRDWRHDPGYDFDTSVGRVDVKGVATRPWYMGVKDTTLAKTPGADLFLLVFCPTDDAHCFVVGYATRIEMDAAPHVEQILDPKRTHHWDARNRDVPDIPGRWLPIAQLRPAHEVMRRLLCVYASDIRW